MKKAYTAPELTVISLVSNKNIAYIASDGDILIDSDVFDDE